MTKKIALTQGKYTTVSDEWYEYLSQWKWYANYQHGKWYAIRGINRKGNKRNIRMHRVVIGAEDGEIVDHKDGDGLNNQVDNLRIATFAGNVRNSKRFVTNTSGYKGVTWNKKLKKWRAQIYVNRKYIYLGYFENKVDAAKAYNDAAIKYHGEFARLNEIPQD